MAATGKSIYYRRCIGPGGMALLSFPPNPSSGQIYPVNPPANVNIYQWDSTEQTWVLIGKSSGATPGTYGTPIAVPEITIDATGRITFVQNVPIQLGDTSQVGLVQLTDNTTSNDSTTALTAAQGYYLQNQIGSVASLNPPAANLVSAINGATAPSGVTAGTYGTSTQIGTFTVNSQGRITSATNVLLALATTSSVGVVRVGANLNVTGTGLLSVPAATTAVAGVSQLVNNTTTNDATKSLTAAQGYSLQQQIDNLNIRNNLTFAGALSAATGLITTASPEGIAVGFIAGNPLPAASSVNDEYFVIISAPGTYAPPGGTPIVCTPGDWLLSDGTQWLFFDFQIGSVTQVNTGAGLSGGPITTTGTISVVPATTSAIGGVISDGSTIAVNSGGVISVRPATTTRLGGVIPDGVTILVSPTGGISAPVQKFVYLDDISSQFDGALSTFTLKLSGTPYTPTPSTNVMITVGGVLQDPNTAYSVSGSTITFTGAPPTGASFIGVTVS